MSSFLDPKIQGGNSVSWTLQNLANFQTKKNSRVRQKVKIIGAIHLKQTQAISLRKNKRLVLVLLPALFLPPLQYLKSQMSIVMHHWNVGQWRNWCNHEAYWGTLDKSLQLSQSSVRLTYKRFMQAILDSLEEGEYKQEITISEFLETPFIWASSVTTSGQLLLEIWVWSSRMFWWRPCGQPFLLS